MNCYIDMSGSTATHKYQAIMRLQKAFRSGGGWQANDRATEQATDPEEASSQQSFAN